MLICGICGEHYWPTSRVLQREDNAICTPCFFANFAGASPPVDMWGTARAALQEYVDAQGPYQLSPRQREAMARLREAWLRQEEAP